MVVQDILAQSENICEAAEIHSYGWCGAAWAIVFKSVKATGQSSHINCWSRWSDFLSVFPESANANIGELVTIMRAQEKTREERNMWSKQ